MIKKIISILLVASLILTILPTMSVSAAGNGGYKTAFQVSVQSKANQKYLKLTGVATGQKIGADNVTAAQISANPVKVDANLGDAGTLMKMEYFTVTGSGALKVNFRATDTNLTMAEVYAVDGNEGTGIYHRSESALGGWESFGLVPQGDGTVALTSNRTAGKYLSVRADGTLYVKTSVTTPTDNEKFIIHTTAIPPAVSGVGFETVTDKSLKISWDALAADAVFTGYEVYRSTSESGTYTKVFGETTATTFTDTSVAKNTTYYYYIKTVNGAETSNDTEKTSVTTAADAPPTDKAVPTAETSTEGTKISWPAVAGATSYDIARGNGVYSTFTTISENINGTSYVDSATLTNTVSQYSYYKIRPRNAGGPGDWSAPISLEKVMFGENMYFYSPDDAASYVSRELVTIGNAHQTTQFSEDRFGFYFKPGKYPNLSTIPVGFYTHIGGLGQTPYDVEIPNVDTPGAEGNRNNTQTFWRSIENVTVLGTTPTTQNGTNICWGVSQAAPIRRVLAKKQLAYQWWYDGNASGGFTADCRLEGGIGYSGQQQWYTRNTNHVVAASGNTGLNTFYQGSTNAPTSKWEDTAYPAYQKWGNHNINVATTPVIREKPFLFLDNDRYQVFVPGIRREAVGTSWSQNNMGVGEAFDIADDFFVVKEGDSAATINDALDAGKNLFFTPGNYVLDDPIRVKNAGTVVLGTGMATLIPSEKNGTAAMIVSDVDGVTIAGLLFDAWYSSDFLLQIGERNSTADHSANPTVLSDIFIRVGGFVSKNCNVDFALQVNSNNVVGDHFWIWRADHGKGVGWYKNTCKNGLLVNGNDVRMYGMFVEHFQEYEVLWNGEGGKLYFLQNETPYDPETQAAYMSHGGTVNGYAQYKVANRVNDHYAIGLGMYDVFTQTSAPEMRIDNAVEVPHKPGVKIEYATVVRISPAGKTMGFVNVINGKGGGTLNFSVISKEHIIKFVNGMVTDGAGITEAGIAPADEVIKTDKADTVLIDANKVDRGNYTATELAALDNAVNELKALLAQGNNALQSDVDVAVNNVNRAIYVVPDKPVDKTKAQSLYNQYKDKSKGNYTDASWNTFKTALDNLKVLLDNGNAVQLDVDAAKAALDLAIANLKVKPPVPVTVPVPTGIKTVSAGATAITVSWKKVSGASGYEIYQSTTKGGKYTLVGNVASSKSSYTNKNLKNGKTYYYKVRAYQKINNANTYSSLSIDVKRKAALSKPTGIKAGAKKASIKISWKKVTGATKYEIYRATSAKGKYKKVATVGKKTSYTNKKLAKGKKYYYKVKAIQKVGKKTYKSAFSTKKSAKAK